MLKKKKNSECEYEIDRELTGKFAIEKNAEYQERIAELEEEKEMLIRQNTLLQESNKKLKEELSRLKSFFKL